ncbi:hypothetical protein DYB37_014005 [Aphanomyces astaci]|uniref:Putative auto-transporter adhesin head GIN domain-containing protein n=1 Tax=Aphanomyces astaci TaxID=112090 RepID=A0A3R6ZVH3_APHAT|nr:hypothetical protein DYB35_012411 [Aphanomyces astaci]RHZ09957.1 hypothetical protein DYB37_014005 [Aphanomyces astaci]
MSDTNSSPNNFVRTWTSGDGTLSGLNSLLPGRLVLSYDPSLNEPATVVVTSSSQELAELVQAEIVPGRKADFYVTGSERVLKLSFPPQNIDISASLLVEVKFNHPISTLTTSTETIVSSGTLSLQNKAANVRVSSLGSKNVWVESANAVTVSKLDITAEGHGIVYVTAPAVTSTKRIKLEVLGSGSVAIQAASVSTDDLKTSVLGSGSAYVHGTVDASDLQSEVLGSGSINYYPAGHCGSSKISLLGSGNAYVASVACTTTKVEVLGSGSAYVQTVDTLSRSGFGSGHVNYFNATPTHLPKEKKHQWYWSPRTPKVVPTLENKFVTFEVAAEPAPLKEGVPVRVYQTVGWFSWPSRGGNVVTDGSSTLTTRLGSGVGPKTAEEFGVGSLAVVLVAIVAFFVFKKNQRRGYAVL